MKKALNEFQLDWFMDELAKKRQIFHNERDFQFEFAWLAKELYDTDIRLECYYGSNSKKENQTKRNYIDIVLQNDSECILIELKYKTLPLREEHRTYENEQFDLLNQGAQDLGSYFILSDLNRLEKLSVHEKRFNNKTILAYYSVLLTNDMKYKKGAKQGTLFADYFIKGPTIPKGSLIFHPKEGKKKEDTCAKDLDDLTFEYDYTVEWKTYGESHFGFMWVYVHHS